MLLIRSGLFSLIFMLFINGPLNAQSNQTVFKKLNSEFPEMEQIPYNFYQDKQGYIWFAGELGLQQFDGYRIRSFPLEDIFDEHETVRSVDQLSAFLNDGQGNLWISYNHALLYYDTLTHTITRFLFEQSPDSLYTWKGDIGCLFEDKKKNLWLGTSVELIYQIPIDTLLDLLSKNKERSNRIVIPSSCIKILDISPEENNPDVVNPIRKIVMDSIEDIWISSDSYLVRCIRDSDSEEYELSRYFEGFYNGNNKSRYQTLKLLFIDNDNNLWLAIEDYLCHITYGSDQKSLNPTEKIDLKDRYIKIYTSQDINRKQRKINIYPLESKTMQSYQYDQHLWTFSNDKINAYTFDTDPFDKLTVNRLAEFEKNDLDPYSWKNGVRKIYRSKDNVLWINDRLNGVWISDLHITNIFNRYYHIPGDRTSLPSNQVRSIHEDYKGNIWITYVRRDSLFYLTDKNFNSFKPHAHHGNIHYIQYMQEDSFRNLWYLAYGNSIETKLEVLNLPNVYARNDQHMHNIRFDKSHFNLKRPDRGITVGGFIIDKNQVIWVAEKSGVYYFDLKAIDSPSLKNLQSIRFKRLINFDSLGIDVRHYWGFQFLHNSRDKIIGISTTRILIINPETMQYQFLDFKNFNQGNHIIFWRLDIDKKNNIWATDKRYLYRLSLAENPDGIFSLKEFKRYTDTDGFPNNPFQVKIDERDRLWFYVDSRGLFLFDQSKNELTNFYGQGVLKGTVWAGMSYMDSDDHLYFQAADGIISFDPEEVRLNPYKPNVEITDIKIHHKALSDWNKRKYLNQFRKSGVLTIPYGDNTISVEFSAMQYTDPIRNQYKYFLRGVDRDTVFTSGRSPKADYSNLPPGKHLFAVYASNNNGVWAENPARLFIHVNHPWWSTPYAYIVYLTLIVGLFLTWRFFDLRNLRLKHAVNIQIAETEKLKEIDQMRSRLFANISHEFRTPLTLIMGPLESLAKGEFTGDIRKQAEIMSRNARRLIRLINQILNLSKIESSRMRLKVCRQDLGRFIRQVSANFESVARKKHIQLNYHLKETIEAYFDPELMEDVIDNLMSNALKFTHYGGSVDIVMNRGHNPNENDMVKGIEHVEIMIRDSGIGIPAEEKDKIFDRFYQSSFANTENYHEGTGIGLALVKEVIKLHKGIIQVESVPGRGTTFIIYLPLGKDHLSEDEVSFVSFDTTSPKDEKTPLDNLSEIQESSAKEIAKNAGERISILIVEDNKDMRDYLRGILEDTYNILEAENGNAAIEIANSLVPDLIITDVMMPEMDGIRFVRHIKSESVAGHIPIIMLTAKADKVSKIRGYETGADEYIIKPFDHDILLTRIKNLVKQRAFLRELFIKQWIKKGNLLSVDSIHDSFKTQLNIILKKNYADPDFGTANLSREIGMSQPVLYRKIKAIFNISPVQFIRYYRISEAKKLLLQGETHISTIAYNTGFNNLSYFSKSFKEVFGISPNEFMISRT